MAENRAIKDTVKIDKKCTKMVAHRGASRLERENTVAAFIAAANRSYFGIETDIHRTGTPHRYAVLHNDSTDENTATAVVNVEQSTAERIGKVRFKAGAGVRDDLRIPWLEDYVAVCRDYGKIGVLEIKTDLTEKEVADVVEIIRGMDYLDGIIFISFIRGVLEKLRAILPDQPIQLLNGEWNDEVKEYLVKNHFDLDTCHRMTREEVEEAHALGIKVNVWTIDDPKVGEELAANGVDFITSNALE